MLEENTFAFWFEVYWVGSYACESTVFTFLEWKWHNLRAWYMFPCHGSLLTYQIKAWVSIHFFQHCKFHVLHICPTQLLLSSRGMTPLYPSNSPGHFISSRYTDHSPMLCSVPILSPCNQQNEEKAAGP